MSSDDPLGRACAQELLQLDEEPIEGGLPWQDHVVLAVKPHEPSAWDGSRHLPPGLEGAHAVVPRVHHQRRNSNLREKFTDVDVPDDLEIASGAQLDGSELNIPSLAHRSEGTI